MNTILIIKCPVCNTEVCDTDIIKNHFNHVCSVCLINDVTIGILKCKHLCLCNYCYHNLKRIKISTV